MAGQRKAQYRNLTYAPGFFSNNSPRDAQGRYIDGDRVRWYTGNPEKLGGWVRQTLSGFNNGVFIDTVRALHDWVSLDAQNFLSCGGNCKLYLINNGQLYDITPLRKSSNLSNPFTTTNGSPIVTVTDPDHRSNDGDHLNIIGATAVGGLTLSGSYDILEVTTPDTYTINAGSNASSSATGGGNPTLEYDISCGLAENGELLGYGTGLYGEGTYGTKRPVGSGVPAKLRSWSLQNWGEDLVASYSDGEFYWWDRSTSPNSRAQLVTEAPANIQRMLVDVEFRRIILLGCTDLDGNNDLMEIRWCSSEDLKDWIPTTTNSAGEHRLDKGSRIVTGLITRTQKLVWTDSQLYAMRAVSDADYGFDPLGNCVIAGPNAMGDVNGVVFFMGPANFYIYDGTLRAMDCDVKGTVFEQTADTAVELTQLEKVYCASYQDKNEVTWFYQSRAGDECDRYVTYNYAEKVFYFGSMPRTAYHDVSEFMTGYKQHPYGVYGGYLYKHEIGTDEVEGTSTHAMEWFLKSGDAAPAGSDTCVLVDGLIPDFQRLDVGMRVTLRAKERPNQANYVEAGPYEIDPYDDEVGATISGSQFQLEFTPALDANGNTALGQDFRMATFQVLATTDGGK